MVVAGSNRNFAKSFFFESAEELSDLPTAEATVLVFGQDAVMAYYGPGRALTGVVGGEADGLTIKTGNKSAGSDGIGIFEGVAVGLAHRFFELVIPDWRVAFVEQRKDCAWITSRNRSEYKHVTHEKVFEPCSQSRFSILLASHHGNQTFLRFTGLGG